MTSTTTAGPTSLKGLAPQPAQRRGSASSPMRLSTQAEAGRDRYDRGLTDLICELSTRSEAFRVRWAAHDVRLHRSGVKNFHHSVVGDLTLKYEALERPPTWDKPSSCTWRNRTPRRTRRSTFSLAGRRHRHRYLPSGAGKRSSALLCTALFLKNNRPEKLTPRSGHHLVTMRRANRRDQVIINDSQNCALSRRKERSGR